MAVETDLETEYEAAKAALIALFDGLTSEEVVNHLTDAGVNGCCETRFEMVAFVAANVGSGFAVSDWERSE